MAAGLRSTSFCRDRGTGRGKRADYGHQERAEQAADESPATNADAATTTTFQHYDRLASETAAPAVLSVAAPVLDSLAQSKCLQLLLDKHAITVRVLRPGAVHDHGSQRGLERQAVAGQADRARPREGADCTTAVLALASSAALRGQVLPPRQPTPSDQDDHLRRRLQDATETRNKSLTVSVRVRA
jgi:hypothetical protein